MVKDISEAYVSIVIRISTLESKAKRRRLYSLSFSSNTAGSSHFKKIFGLETVT